MSGRSDRPLPYRVLTGLADRAFCERISAALDAGIPLARQPRHSPTTATR